MKTSYFYKRVFFRNKCAGCRVNYKIIVGNYLKNYKTSDNTDTIFKQLAFENPFCPVFDGVKFKFVQHSFSVKHI